MQTDIINVALNCKCTPCIEVAYTNYLASSLNIFISKTLVPSSSVLFIYPSIDKKPYYNSGISLSGSIGPTNISL